MAHAYNIVYQHSLNVPPKDLSTYSQCAMGIIEKVNKIENVCRQVRNTKRGKSLITTSKLTFAKQFKTLDCAAFVSKNFAKEFFWFVIAFPPLFVPWVLKRLISLFDPSCSIT